MQREGLVANEITYAAVIAACHKHPDVVLSLLQRMDKVHVQKNTVVLTSAINALAGAGENYTGKVAS